MKRKFNYLSNSTVSLFLTSTLIWGTTWFVIIGQLGVVAPEVSIFYRFAISSALLFSFCYFLKIQSRFKKNDHFWLFIQGIFNFSLNYIFTYHAEEKVTTGVVALTFSILPYFNAIGMYFLFKKKLSMKIFLGMILGGIGLALIFKSELNVTKDAMSGILLGVVATFFASLGNLTSVRHFNKGHHLLPILAWGMFYGSIFSALICLLFSKPFIWDSRPYYLWSLLYLSVIGTAIAFLTYYKLIEKIGPARAAYTSIMIPIIALIVSYIFEAYPWSWLTTIGLTLCLFGNYLVLKEKHSPGNESTLPK